MIFWTLGHGFRRPENITGVGEITNQPTVVSSREFPYADVVGDHYEGSEADHAGQSYRPGGLYRPYEPSPVMPECTFRPAVGIGGGLTDIGPTYGSDCAVGFTGGDVLSCPINEGITAIGGGIVYDSIVGSVFGMGGGIVYDSVVGNVNGVGGGIVYDSIVGSVAGIGGGILSDPIMGSPVGFGGGIVYGSIIEGTFGLQGGTWCGSAPVTQIVGQADNASLIGGLSLEAFGSVAGFGAFSGTMDANLDAGLELDGVGDVEGPPAFAGVMDANLDGGLELEGDGCVIPPMLEGFTDLWNTGVNDLGFAAPSACVTDTHWNMDGSAAVGDSIGSPDWYANSLSCASRWLTPECDESHVNDAVTPYTYSLDFQVDVGTELTGHVLRGRIMADDDISDLRVNGVSTGFTLTSGWLAWHDFEIDSSLLSTGANTIEVDVLDSVGVNWTGFRLEWLSYDEIGFFGTANANLDAGLELDGVGDVEGPPAFAGVMDANLDGGLELIGEAWIQLPVENAGLMNANLEGGLELDGDGAVT